MENLSIIILFAVLAATGCGQDELGSDRLFLTTDSEIPLQYERMDTLTASQRRRLLHLALIAELANQPVSYLRLRGRRQVNDSFDEHSEEAFTQVELAAQSQRLSDEIDSARVNSSRRTDLTPPPWGWCQRA